MRTTQIPNLKMMTMNPEEVPVIRLIKKEFDEFLKWKEAYGFTDGKVCNLGPFVEENHWMYHFLYPEIGRDFQYPCNIMPEDQVLRILAESGII